jgi:hypothetical protein
LLARPLPEAGKGTITLLINLYHFIDGKGFFVFKKGAETVYFDWLSVV